MDFTEEKVQKLKFILEDKFYDASFFEFLSRQTSDVLLTIEYIQS